MKLTMALPTIYLPHR